MSVHIEPWNYGSACVYEYTHFSFLSNLLYGSSCQILCLHPTGIFLWVSIPQNKILLSSLHENRIQRNIVFVLNFTCQWLLSLCQCICANLDLTVPINDHVYTLIQTSQLSTLAVDLAFNSSIASLLGI